jgi:hypothetical protein
MRRATLVNKLLSPLPVLIVLIGGSVVQVGCAETQSGERPVTVLKNDEPPPQIGGIPPDKQAEIQLLLQQRDTSTLKCYQDVLNDKHDRAFKGSVFVVLTLDPNGRAADVRVVGGTLNNPEVGSCLVEKLKEFDYPQLPNRGSMQYEYRFEPAY